MSMMEALWRVLMFLLLGGALGLTYTVPHGLNMRLFDREQIVPASLLFLVRLSIVGLAFIRVAQVGWLATVSTISAFLCVLLVDYFWNPRRPSKGLRASAP